MFAYLLFTSFPLLLFLLHFFLLRKNRFILERLLEIRLTMFYLEAYSQIYLTFMLNDSVNTFFQLLLFGLELLRDSICYRMDMFYANSWFLVIF